LQGHKLDDAVGMRCGLTWRDVVLGVVRCGVIWCGVWWCDVWFVWCGVVVWYVVIWRSVMWRSVAYCGVIVYDVRWCWTMLFLLPLNVIWCHTCTSSSLFRTGNIFEPKKEDTTQFITTFQQTELVGEIYIYLLSIF